MKTKILISALLLTLSLTVNSFAGDHNRNNWTSGTAQLLPRGRMEIGLFQPLRYGWSDHIEISTHPLIDFVMPNLNVKWAHNSLGKFQFATKHGIYYPTPLLRLISREGTGGIISPEFEIPHMVSIYNEIILSHQLHKNHQLTGKLGFSFAIKSDGLDSRTTIDLPIIFPRLAVFYHGFVSRAGLEIQGKLFKRWNYFADTDVFYTPTSDEAFAAEHKGLLIWTKSSRFQICLGYKLVYGEYPFGTQWHLFLPLFDLQWAWQVK